MNELTFVKQLNIIIPNDKLSEEYINKLKTGDVIRGEFKKARNPLFHRKYFALLNFAFDHMEAGDIKYKGETVQPNFDEFRANLAILAGFYVAVYDIQGVVHLRAKSISFARMSADDFEKLYNRTIDIILKKVLVNYSDEELRQVVDNLLNFA